MLNQFLLEQLSDFQIVVNQHGNLEVTGYLNDDIRQKIRANKPQIIQWVKSPSHAKNIALKWLDLIQETNPENIEHVVNVAIIHPKTLQFIERRIDQLIDIQGEKLMDASFQTIPPTSRMNTSHKPNCVGCKTCNMAFSNLQILAY